MKKIGVLGSSGSIGRQALEFIESNAEFRAEVLVAHSNADLLINQALKFCPSAVGLIDEKAYDKGKFACLSGVKIAVGKEAFDLFDDVDVILFAAVGCDVLPALMSYIRKGKKIALANKECLVSAGSIIMTEAQRYGAEIIPVDSEHSAIWQCLRAGQTKDVKEIILTASGGRYYSYPISELKKITPDEAVKHPNWKMGKKISVDSATMMNKALELVEARWLFGTKNVGYIIHPESIIHSMVLFEGGAIIAQMSEPDMKLPISIALSYPDRLPSGGKNFEFDRPLTFLPKREDVFFAPTLAEFCINEGGSAGAIMDAANEGAVKLFLGGHIAFSDIADIVRRELTSTKIDKNPTLDDIIELHDEVKNKVIYKEKK
ncbi:MAG: 1-deoxy-D-xylulose-5-phosphate reductoisomerase [Clostridiales bacterium]|nr:1-deoxy-D-xylulose-5-phosphate reductoisomerase [Clostridiales bacterium]